ncbi:MAG TPA: HAD family hydrolase [Pyrinomonadaceae bacterium]
MDGEIDFVFFDIGGTLGERDASGKFKPFPSSAGLLRAMREAVGLRVGIITTLGGQLTDAEALELLEKEGLRKSLDPDGFVSDNKAGAAKPDPAIYLFAAEQAGVPVGRCLYVGENLIEVIGAVAAGMKAVLKPSPPGRELPS